MFPCAYVPAFSKSSPNLPQRFPSPVTEIFYRLFDYLYEVEHPFKRGVQLPTEIELKVAQQVRLWCIRS